jgi:flagellar biosynthetic protein FliR
VNFQVETNTLLAVLLGAARCGAWLMITPPFSARGVPTPIKALLSVAIVVPLTPRLAAQVPVDPSTAVLIALLVEQIVIGAALGFLTAILFAALQSAGNLIDVTGGFSLAFAVDPFGFQGNAVFGRFYNILATALLFATDAHQLVLRGFTESYKAIPLNGALSLEAFNRVLTTGLAEMFVSALQIAGPLIAVLFCTDIALGLLSRAAPALNAFNLGFPAKILLTLVLMASAIMLLPQAIGSLTDKAVHAVLAVLQASR